MPCPGKFAFRDFLFEGQNIVNIVLKENIHAFFNFFDC